MYDWDRLLATVPNHRAINNPFYDRWAAARLSARQLRIFVGNYGAFVRHFPAVLAKLIAGVEDATLQCEYTKTLFSEMGNGDLGRAHSVLFDRFFGALVERVSDGLGCVDAEGGSLLETTTAFLRGEDALYGASSSARGVGAQLALEWQAYTMLVQLYEGARNYRDLWDTADGFHEAAEYFYAHIGEVEKDHKVEALSVAKRVVKSDTDWIECCGGFKSHLGLIADFWEGLDRDLGKIG